jgi:hypothetical protein
LAQLQTERDAEDLRQQSVETSPLFRSIETGQIVDLPVMLLLLFKTPLSVLLPHIQKERIQLKRKKKDWRQEISMLTAIQPKFWRLGNTTEEIFHG